MSCLHSRRSFLRASSSAVLSLPLAGCSELRQQTQGLRLGDVVLHNWHSETHHIRIEIERNGELMKEESFEVPGETMETMEATWPNDPAIYDLYYLIFGPAVDTDIRKTELTSQDAQTDGNGCTIVTIDFGMESGAGVGLSLGPSGDGAHGDCTG